MDRHHAGRDSAPEYRLSHDSAREVAGRTGPPRSVPRFLSTEHLSTEAAAAYVDSRLPAAGKNRADAHLQQCPQCRREVADQHAARHALRRSGPIHMPRHLHDRLRSLGDGPVPEHEKGDDRESRSPWSGLLRRLRGFGR